MIILKNMNKLNDILLILKFKKRFLYFYIKLKLIIKVLYLIYIRFNLIILIFIL